MEEQKQKINPNEQLLTWRERETKDQRIKEKIFEAPFLISGVYFLVILSSLGYALWTSQETAGISLGWIFALIATHLLPFVIIPVTMWIFYQRSNFLREKGLHSPFAIQLGLAFLMVASSCKLAENIQQQWFYRDDYSALGFMFYAFSFSAFALWADGFVRNKWLDLLLAFTLVTISILYPLGAQLDNPQFKIPIYLAFTLVLGFLTDRAYRILRDWRIILFLFFSLGVNLFFVFLLNQYETNTTLNPLFNVLQELLGTQIGLVIFTYLVYVNPSRSELIFNLGLPLCTQQSEPASVLPGQLDLDCFRVVIEAKGKPLDSLLYLPVGTKQVPVVLFNSGGTISLGPISGERYQWLGKMLASNGFGAMFVLSTPTSIIFDWAQAVLEFDWTQAMLERLSQADLAPRVNLDKVILGGHSFGGLIVSCLLDGNACPILHGRISRPAGLIGAFTLNSYLTREGSTNLLRVGDIPMMLVTGTEDGLSAPEKVTQSFEALAGKGPFYLVILEGVNHFQAIDCLKPAVDIYKNDHPAQVSHAVALERMGQAILAFLQLLAEGSEISMDKLAQETGIQVRKRKLDSLPNTS